MIQEFVDKFIEKQNTLFLDKHPDSYEDIVKEVIKTINPDEEYGEPNPEKIHRINDGSYQGTLVFVIPEVGYQPWDYWYVRVSYGSCSGCDTLQRINGFSYDDDDKPSEQQSKDYQTLALHIVQKIKKMGYDE